MAHRNPDRAAPLRDPEARRRDHDAIDRLTDTILPDLVSRLAASGLSEIEVREDDWRIRLRRPRIESDEGHDRGGERPDRTERSMDRQTRGTPAAPMGGEPRVAHDAVLLRATTGDGNGSGPGSGLPATRVTALSPAVGVFQAGADVRPGTRVRAGDRLGVVDLLGLPQEVVAPEDGVVVDTLVESGEGVEYGQALVVIEPVNRARSGPAGSPAVSPVMESE